MSQGWYVQHNGKTVGPVSSGQLKQLAGGAKISPQTRLRKGKDGDWVRAAKVNGLFQSIDLAKPEREVSAERKRRAERPPLQDQSQVAQRSCPFCGELIAAAAVKCRHCNEFLDDRPREQTAPAPVVQVSQVVHNTNTNAIVAEHTGPEKSKFVAIILALFVGGLGIQHFYMGRTGRGLLYLVFCWTFIPAILGVLEAIWYIPMSNARFQSRCSP